MAKSDVMNLTNEELCIRVAELIGWKQSEEAGYIYPFGKDFGAKCGPLWWKDPQGKWATIPNYSGDIAAAWELVDYIRDGWGYNCSVEQRLDGSWSAHFAGLGGEDTGGNLCADPFYLASAKTPQRAIVRAFILTMEGEHE